MMTKSHESSVQTNAGDHCKGKHTRRLICDQSEAMPHVGREDFLGSQSNPPQVINTVNVTRVIHRRAKATYGRGRAIEKCWCLDRIIVCA